MREFLSKRFPELVNLFTLLGFLTLLAELLLTGHTEGVQVVAPLAAGVGAAASGLGLLAPALRPWGVGLLLLVGASGLLGLANHLGETLEGAQILTLQTVDEEGTEYPTYPQGENGLAEEGEETPPPLAPLSLSGLGLLGALALYVKRPCES